MQRWVHIDHYRYIDRTHSWRICCFLEDNKEQHKHTQPRGWLHLLYSQSSYERKRQQFVPENTLRGDKPRARALKLQYDAAGVSEKSTIEGRRTVPDKFRLRREGEERARSTPTLTRPLGLLVLGAWGSSSSSSAPYGNRRQTRTPNTLSSCSCVPLCSEM